METATRLFRTKSYEALGIQQIALEVNLTKPTIYYYFRSKRGLLEAILKDYATGFLDQQRAASVYEGDVKGTMERVARGVQEFYLKHKDFYYLYRSMGAMAEETGILSDVWVGDSILSKPRLECIPLLGAIAGRTRRVKLGVACMATIVQRNPVVFGLQWASLDVLSEGRTLLAACMGYPPIGCWMVMSWPPRRTVRLTSLAFIKRRSAFMPFLSLLSATPLTAVITSPDCRPS